jgi:bifunctional DNase/RNase
MNAETVELEVRGVWPAHSGAAQAAVVVCRRGDAAREWLTLQISAGDAHALHHELQGEQTPRSQAVCLAAAIAVALGGQVTAARLVSSAPGLVAAELDLETGAGRTTVPATPGQACAAAVCLGTPLYAPADLFPVPETTPAEAVLPPSAGADPFAQFIATLDLDGLGSTSPG